MSEPMQGQAVEPRADAAGVRSSVPPRPTTRRPPSSTTPKPPAARAVVASAAGISQVRGSTPPPLPVRASVLPPPPLPLPLRAALAVPAHEPPAPPPSTAPASGSDTREELRRLVGQADEALVALQTAIREIDRRLASLEAGTAPRQPAPASSDAPGSRPGAAGSAFRRLASRLVEAIGRLAWSWPPITRRHPGVSGSEGRGIVAAPATPRELEQPPREIPG
jgi:hypothetical protein